MSFALNFTRSKEALDEFMECLQCKKCKNLVENPKIFIDCAHFFCANCIPKNPSTCMFCGIPVKPNDVQSDFMVDNLVKSSIDLYNLINERKYGNKENDIASEKSASTIGKRKPRKDKKAATNEERKSDEFEKQSVSSIAKSSKLSISKESLNLDLEDSTIISKKVLKNLNKPNRKGEVPLHTACVKGDVKLVKALLNAGADANTKDYANLTPLQEAASYGFYEICNMLLQSGALPNMPGSNNQTALHAAVQSNNIKEAELLVKYGANLNARDDHGKIPEDYCQSDEMRHILINTQDKSDELSQSNFSLNATIVNSVLDSNHLVVLPVNLKKDNIELLKSVSVKHKFNIVTSFRKVVTHVVTKTNDKGEVDLSYDICLAILHGKWILTFDWVSLLDHETNADIDASIFEVTSIAHSLDTPRKARENSQQFNPRLFNNCIFYFALNNKSTYIVGNMELTKDQIVKIAIEGEGRILKRMPRPEDITDEDIVPYHTSCKPDHPLYKCSHYIIYEPGRDEPKLKYNMKSLKTLPLIWFIESIEKFQLMNPVNYGLDVSTS